MKQHLALLLAGCLATASMAGELALSKNGKTAYGIVLPAEPTPVEKTAARELSEHLKAITGGDFAVASEGGVVQTPAIYVGATDAVKKAFPDLDLAKLPADSIVLESKDGNLYLAGEPVRGTLYAVYTFLEDYAGVRWWTSTESTIPNTPNLSVPELHIRYSPKLFSRETHYGDARTAIFAARLKNNGHYMVTPPDYGGHTSIIGFCHTFHQFLPPEKYFKDHPEWFSLYKGERHADTLNYQLCLTNEEMTQEFIKVCLAKIAENPSAGIIDVSQNDSYFCGACQCENCQKLVDENGSQSGPLIYFVNKVAEAVEKEYPNFYVETLAYSYSRNPPKVIRPRDNVIIRLCVSMKDTQSLPFGTCEDQIEMRACVDEWAKIAKNLYFWEYLANYRNYLLPHPTYGHYGDDIRYFIEKGAVGLFMQGDYFTTCGDFIRPRAWIIAHLQWNPELDERKLAEEFFNGYYGAAGPILLQYCDMMRKSASEHNAHMSNNVTLPPDWADKATILKGRELFDKALEKVKDDPVLYDRVRRERITLDVLSLNWHIYTMNKVKFGGKELTNDDFVLPDAEKIAGELVVLLQKWDNQFISEGQMAGNFAQGLLDAIQTPANIPEICVGRPQADYDLLSKNSYALVEQGMSSDWEDDPTASDGRAVTMPGNSKQWALQVRVHEYPSDQYFRACILARVDADADDGTGFQFGVHHDAPKEDSGNVVCDVPLKDCKGSKYKLFMSEPFKPGSGGGYFWVAPMARPLTEMKKLYIDQVFLLRESAPLE